MAVDARVVTLKVQAKLSADLAFYEGGNIENAQPGVGLGAQVSAYSPRAALYPRLNELQLDQDGKPTGRLVFDSQRLRSELLSKAIFVLDNDARAADLDQAILARQNDWLTLYRHVGEVFAEIDKDTKDKLASLSLLRDLVDHHHNDIEAAYGKEETQVDQNKLIDDPKHDATIRPTTINTIKMAGVATVQRGLSTDYQTGSGAVISHGVNQFTTVGKFKGGDPNSEDQWEVCHQPEPTVVAQQITSIVQSDGITHPRLENHMRHERLVADLSDELLMVRVFSKRIPYLSQIWNNELDGIDLEIRKLQIAYIDTFLFSPFDGNVTSLYKQVGENARAGDPVVRVENESSLLLSGLIVCASVPSVGQSVKVVTKCALGDKASPTATLNGKIVMVRGAENLCGRWNVTFDVVNAGGLKIPAGYEFDAGSPSDPQSPYTTVTIS